MTNEKLRVLIVEDSPSLAVTYQAYLRGEPYRVSHVADGAGAMAALRRDPPEGMLLDLKLPDMDGMEVLRHIHRHNLPTAVIIGTSYGSVDLAVDAMRYGAADFIEKPFDAQRLHITLRNALERRRLSALVDHMRREFQRDRFHGFIGSSLPMQAVYRIIESAAPSRATVFITGESGTGKGVCAAAIHQESPRRDRPFITVDSASTPRELMESEIFGHVRGAFPGAGRERVGAAREADGGTLFLDGIDEMDLELQSKLLRFVQTGTFHQAGADESEAVDVRLVCAANRPLREEVAQGRFREDLYYRLHVIPLRLPPLRERREDVLPIALHFLRRFAREEDKPFRAFSEDARAALLGHDWPGNVRQLENAMRNVVVLHAGETVTRRMLPAPLDADPAPAAGGRGRRVPVPDLLPMAAVKPLWQVEKDAIEQAIAECGGNIPQAAALLQVSPSTIYRKLQAWENGPEGRRRAGKDDGGGPSLRGH